MSMSKRGPLQHLTGMKRLVLIGTIAAFGLTGIFAQESAKQDIKNAGSETKQAGKDVGRATKKGAHKTTHAVKRGVHKGASATERGASKVKNKTTS